MNEISFFKLYESSSKAGNDFWFKPHAPEASLEIIQRGLEIRADRTDGNTFWDDFVAVFGQNTEEAAKLLDVPRDRIAHWPQKIRRLLDMIRDQNDNTDKKKADMLPTGGF